ncbi:hypothetical protein K1719_000378 [Acacia pycnantha]|nr:hypothetical protein K1719_000378 [Acacia pycnantha]
MVSKKINNVESSEKKEEWPSLTKKVTKLWGAGLSFIEKLQGINQGEKGAEEGGKDQGHIDDISSDSASEIKDSEPLCLITKEANRNFPKFNFFEKMKKCLHKAWHQAVIVKLLGRNIGYKSLLSILQTLWAKYGIINLINVGSGFFVVKLSNKDDYLNALTGGPWMLFDHYLIVRPWEPLLHPWKPSIDKVAVWREKSKGERELEVSSHCEQDTWTIVKKFNEKKNGSKEKQVDHENDRGLRFGVLFDGVIGKVEIEQSRVAKVAVVMG